MEMPCFILYVFSGERERERDVVIFAVGGGKKCHF